MRLGGNQPHAIQNFDEVPLSLDEAIRKVIRITPSFRSRELLVEIQRVHVVVVLKGNPDPLSDLLTRI